MNDTSINKCYRYLDKRRKAAVKRENGFLNPKKENENQAKKKYNNIKKKYFDELGRLEKVQASKKGTRKELPIANSKEELSINQSQENLSKQRKEENIEHISLHTCSQKLKKRAVIIVVEGRLYYFDNYCFQPLSPQKLLEIYRDYVDEQLHGAKNTRISNELYNYLLADSKIKVRPNLENLADLVILKNGIYNVRKRKLLKQDSPILAFSYVDAFYVENEDCPKFKQFLEDVTGGNKALIKRMWMALGYILMQSNDAKVFFVMGQASNSGKSLFGHFIQNLFESQYVSSIALTDMNKEFSLGQIVGKAVNVSLDLPHARLNASAVSRLKMLTGGDLITISEKYVPQFKYQNRAKFIFASNHPIELVEDDEAFWNRMIYLPFDYSVSKEEQNVNLLKELLQEKDAIVSKAIKYARILVENNYEFPTTDEIEKRIRQWRGIEEDSINEFIKKCCYIDSECRGELMEDLYAVYLQFCADIDVKAVKRAVLKQYLEKQIGLVHFKMRKGNTDNPQSAFKGIGLLTRGGSL